ncbi:thiamine-phosphate kinase [Enterovirga rhinocerotis]|uniref:Thiamine-monophosphate kinase n=1 Tax=Enterovirga rhinocerotis TaxID=1339210 RepID=A0A4R7C9R8_9HYPH|nr:thiamine-phosphate kinase [Enterovirga rhinocerotis]TDR94105.1 thiamine-phosphate kinase [Enterovirga rhinocerotis]
MARASEDDLIARHFAPLAGKGGLGLRDDAAEYAPTPGHDLVLTADALVAGVHFLPDDPPRSIGVKALGVNLSDLAAKGATPVGFLLALALPDSWTEEWLAAFCEGLGAISSSAGCALLGGDTVRAAGPLTLSITALGEVPAGRMVRRTTARPGDLICVTGSIGDAVLGLALLGSEQPVWRSGLATRDAGFLIDRYREPQPRGGLAEALRDLANAAMDVSDGLAGDVSKMLRASGVGGVIDLDRVPWSGAAAAVLAQAPEFRDRLVAGGDDYEILFTLPETGLPAMRQRSAEAGIPITVIGRVMDGDSAITFRDGGLEHRLGQTSYQHFR